MIVTEIGLILRLAALLLMGIFVLPKQAIEARVKNGLARFRKGLLALGIIIVLNIGALGFYHAARLYGWIDGADYINVASLLGSSCNFLAALLLVLFYKSGK